MKELEKKIEEQTCAHREQVAHQQVEYERFEREIVDLREELEYEREARARNENLHDEKEETRDQVLMHELECQELRTLVEEMVCEQRKSNARVQQERNDAAREMERRLRRVLLDIADNEARVQELASKVKENARTREEHLRLEREKTEHEMGEIRQIICDQRTAAIQEAVCAQELAIQELNRREEVMALAQSERDARLEQEHSKVAREIEERLQKVQADMIGKAVQVQEALRAQGLAVEGLKSQMVSVVSDISCGDRPLRNALQDLPGWSDDLPVTAKGLWRAVLRIPI